MKNSNSYNLSLVGSSRHPGIAEATRSTTIGMAVLDRDYCIVWSNAAAGAHLGIDSTGGCLAGHSLLAGFLDAGNFSAPLRLETPQGMVLSIEVQPFFDTDWLLLSRDVTRCEKVQAMRRDFVADTSHELRAPLCVMTGLVETMSELEPDAARTAEYLDLMAQQCKRMRNIVEGLLELSALEAMPVAGLDERINVTTLLARLRAEAEVLSGGRHTIALDAQPGFDLLGSERDITSALGNLVANAVRYTQPGGEVRILWHASTKGAEFVVEDTGVGIDAEHIPLLTERFYRVHKALGARRGQGGAGLGLAIVKAALAKHQAGLEITSEAGKGSRFVARFPAHRLAPRSAKVATLAA